MTGTIIFYLILQFIIQFVLYKQLVIPVVWVNKFFINKNTYKHMFKILMWQFFALNILISVIVKAFTAAGGMTGMTNLGASVLVGVIMYIDAKRITTI